MKIKNGLFLLSNLRETHKLFLVGFFIFFVAVVPFLGNLHDPFVSDDWDMLYVNTHYQTPWYQYFVTNQLGETEGGSYRPVESLYWRTGFVLSGLNPVGMHAGNILLHGLNAVLVFVLVGLLFKKNDRCLFMGVVAGLFFALFPNRAEPVIWVGVPDPLVTFFFLFSLVLFLQSLGKGDACRLFVRFFSVSLAALAIFTKEMALTLPAVIFISSWFLSADDKQLAKIKRAVIDAAPYVAVVGFYFFVRYQVLGLLFGYYGPGSEAGLFDLGRTFLDLTLSNLASGQLFSILRTPAALWLVLIIILAGGFLIVRRRAYRKVFLVLVVFYLVSLIPVIKLAISSIPDFVGNDGERYAYLSSVFFAILLAWLLNLIKKKTVAVTGSVVLIFLLAVQLVPKTATWHQAANLAERSLVEVSEILENGQYDGALIVGLPDQLNGAAVFRNVFVRALSFYRSDQAVVFGIFNHSYHDLGETYFLTKLDDFNYSYQTTSNKKLLAAPQNFDSADYGLGLWDPKYVERNNEHWLGSDLRIKFPERLLEENRIAVIYFDGTNWQVSEVGK